MKTLETNLFSDGLSILLLVLSEDQVSDKIASVRVLLFLGITKLPY